MPEYPPTISSLTSFDLALHLGDIKFLRGVTEPGELRWPGLLADTLRSGPAPGNTSGDKHLQWTARLRAREENISIFIFNALDSFSGDDHLNRELPLESPEILSRSTSIKRFIKFILRDSLATIAPNTHHSEL